MRKDKNVFMKKLLNERYYFLFTLLNSLCFGWKMNSLCILILTMLLAYLVRGFLSLVYIVNGVESYIPARNFGLFFFPGDEQYISIFGSHFRLQSSPVYQYVFLFFVSVFVYLLSVFAFWGFADTSMHTIITNSIFLGLIFGALKNGIHAHIEYQANMVKAKQMFFAYQGDVETLAKVEAYRCLQVSKHFEKMWSKEYAETSHDTIKKDGLR